MYLDDSIEKDNYVVFNAIFNIQLYSSGHCTFPLILLTTTSQNILFKPLAASKRQRTETKQLTNIDETTESHERGMNPVKMTNINP